MTGRRRRPHPDPVVPGPGGVLGEDPLEPVDVAGLLLRHQQGEGRPCLLVRELGECAVGSHHPVGTEGVRGRSVEGFGAGDAGQGFAGRSLDGARCRLGSRILPIRRAANGDQDEGSERTGSPLPRIHGSSLGNMGEDRPVDDQPLSPGERRHQRARAGATDGRARPARRPLRSGRGPDGCAASPTAAVHGDDRADRRRHGSGAGAGGAAAPLEPGPGRTPRDRPRRRARAPGPVPRRPRRRPRLRDDPARVAGPGRLGPLLPHPLPGEPRRRACRRAGPHRQSDRACVGRDGPGLRERGIHATDARSPTPSCRAARTSRS